MKFNKYFNIFIVITLSIISIIINTVLFKFCPSINKFSPNLILLIIIYLAIFRDIYEGAGLVFFISYLYSLHSPSFIGGVLCVHMILFFMVSFLKDLKAGNFF